MKRQLLFTTIFLLSIFDAGSVSVKADIVLTTSTIDSADLDFDGSGTETFGDLGLGSRTFLLTGGAIPSAPGFENITSITLTFQSAVGTTLSAGGLGIAPDGIGLTHFGESGTGDIESLSDGVGELLSIFVSSTSSNSGQQVFLTGVSLNSWRNAFPLSEVTLTSASFGGGLSVLTGGPGVSPDILFDNPTASFSLESTGPDPIRLASIRLGVTSVPEPATGCLIFSVAGCLLVGRRKSRRRNAGFQAR